MKGLVKAVRCSGVGVFFAGIVSFIQGCSQNDINFVFLLWLITLFFGGGGVGEEAANGDGAPPPAPLTEITMFNAGTGQGNWNGRAGADLTCQNHTNRPVGHADDNVRAFITVSSTDEIRDMPANYGVPTNLPIVGPGGIVISTDWAGLFDSTIDQSYVNAGIQPVAVGVWSGSTAQGAEVAGSTCTGWTSNGNDGGSVGRSELATGGQFLTVGTLLCQGAATLLCVAF